MSSMRHSIISNRLISPLEIEGETDRQYDEAMRRYEADGLGSISGLAVEQIVQGLVLPARRVPGLPLACVPKCKR